MNNRGNRFAYLAKLCFSFSNSICVILYFLTKYKYVGKT